METKNNTIVIILVTLVIGIVTGYFYGTANMSRSVQKSAPIAGMHSTMSGMMMGLDGKTGDALDEAFLDEMTVHHQGAIEMAKKLLQGTKRPELVKLGNGIITAQTGEIETMKQWRKDWFGR